MDWTILAYLGAALMVVLALAAYRSWKSTASYVTHGSADDGPGTSVENPGAHPEVEDPPVDEGGRNDSPEQVGRVGTSTASLMREFDEQLAALPSGIELIDLPILERRRIADRREELLRDRRRLLDHSPQGTHRRRGRSRKKD